MKNIFILILSIIIFYVFFGNIKEAFSENSNYVPVIYKSPITLSNDTSSYLIYNLGQRTFKIAKCESSTSCDKNLRNYSGYSLVKLTKINSKYYLTTYTAPESGRTNFITLDSNITGWVQTVNNKDFSTSSTKIPRNAIYLDRGLIRAFMNKNYMLNIEPNGLGKWVTTSTTVTKFTNILQE